MKTHYILSALLALGTAVTSTQAIASGLTYDPVGDYYSEYYGVGEKQTVVEEETQIEPAFYDPYAIYYNTYYGIDSMLDKSNNTVEVVTPEYIVDMDSMADPTNYYNW